MKLPSLRAFAPRLAADDAAGAARRRLLVAGVAGFGAVAGATLLWANASGGGRRQALPADLDLSRIEALGDGFYLVDGWVLTADDIERLGGDLSRVADRGL